MAIKKRMVGIVGVGHVGAHVAFNLGMMGIADEVLLCDLKESKVTSEVQDLNDAVMYMPNHVVYKASDYAGLKDCDVIVSCRRYHALRFRQPRRGIGKQCETGGRLCPEGHGRRIPRTFCEHYESL